MRNVSRGRSFPAITPASDRKAQIESLKRSLEDINTLIGNPQSPPFKAERAYELLGNVSAMLVRMHEAATLMFAMQVDIERLESAAKDSRAMAQRAIDADMARGMS